MTYHKHSVLDRKMIKRGSALPSPASPNPRAYVASPGAVMHNAARLLYKAGDLHSIHRTRLGG